MNARTIVIGLILLLFANGCSQNEINKQFPEKLKVVLNSTNPEKVVDAQVVLDIEKLKQQIWFCKMWDLMALIHTMKWQIGEWMF